MRSISNRQFEKRGIAKTSAPKWGIVLVFRVALASQRWLQCAMPCNFAKCEVGVKKDFFKTEVKNENEVYF